MLYIFNQYRTMFLAGVLAWVASTVMSQPMPDVTTFEVTYNKTSSIIFPAGIKTVDRGSRDVLIQKAEGVENVLQVKAGKVNFPETNLTVITEDGRLYQFTVQYAAQPVNFVLPMETLTQTTADCLPLMPTTQAPPLGLGHQVEVVRHQQPTVHFVRTSKHKMHLALCGVYIKDDVLFFRLRMTNDSNIPYAVDFTRCYITDTQNLKRTASQEATMTPLYGPADHPRVSGTAEVDLVYAFPRFTLPDAKKFVIEFFEANGGRHLQLSIHNRQIIRARRLGE